ncbi:hypothetical protein QBC37DRAFT_401209 [Rhypophila decipiens]|uniref:Ankyrin repeat protein n=1 Tax=Rhypophila decipiens TaxID=261697 RepID=A0AAN6Y5X0_9PEZI|nr:hypothetical protein QBC37DRAFT_401209 [Rhypophila decipiens]
MDSSSSPDNPSTQPPLLRCPNEIILMFSELLGSAMESRRSFALTCRRVFEQTEGSMYRDNIRHQEGSAMLWAAVNGNIETMEKAIAAKGDISGHYRDANKTILKLQCPRTDGFPPCGPCPGCPICRSMWRARYPLLHSALAKGQDDMAVYLVLKGADICEDAGPCFGWYMNLPAWKMWVSKSFDYYIRWSCTPLLLAISQGFITTARLLLSQGALRNKSLDSFSVHEAVRLAALLCHDLLLPQIVAGISDLAPVLKKVPADRRPVTVHQSHLLWPYGPRVGNPLSKDAIYFPLKYGSDRTTSTIEVLAAMGADVVKAENFNDPKRTSLYKALRRQRWNMWPYVFLIGLSNTNQARKKNADTPKSPCPSPPGDTKPTYLSSLQYAAGYCCVSPDALDMVLILLELGFNADQISECSAPMTTCRCYQRFRYQTTGVSLRTPLKYLVDAFDVDHHVDFGIQYEEDMHAYLETCTQTVRLHSKEKRLLSGIDLLLSRGASPMRPWLSQSEKGEADDKITIMEKVLSRFDHAYNNHKDARVGLNTLKVTHLFLKHAERSSLPAEMIDKLRHWIPAATRTVQQRPPVTNLTIRGLVWTGLPRTYDNNPRLYALMDYKYPRPGILEIFRPRPKPSLQRPISSVPSEYLCYLTSAEIPPADVLEDCSWGARYVANPPILMLPWAFFLFAAYLIIRLIN